MKRALFCTLILLFYFSNHSYSVNYFWVNGSGNWSDFANHWATTSGGSTFHTQIPTSADNVIFDGNSFTGAGQTVTVDQTFIYCNDMNWTGATNNPTFAGSNTYTLKIYGSLTFISAMSYTFDGPVSFEATTTGKTINLAGKAIRSYVYFNGIGGEWNLQDSLTLVWYRDIYLNNGTLRTNNYDVFARSFNSTSGNTRALYMGTSVFRLGDGSTFWNVSSSGLTLDATSSVIVATHSGGNIPAFNGGGLAYNNLYFTGTAAAAGTVNGGNTFNTVSFAADYPGFNNTINGNNSINTLTFINGAGAINGDNVIGTLTLAAGKSYTFQSGKTLTVTTINAPSTCSKYITLKSSSAGSQANISSPTSFVFSYLSLKDMNATGTGAPFIANNSIDQGNNTGWNISTPAARNVYWVGGTGNWSDGAHWSLTSGGAGCGCAPIYIDNVRFDANSFTGGSQTVTIDVNPASCNDMDWTGVTNTPTFAGNLNPLHIYGSLTLSYNMNYTSTGPVYFYSNSAGETINTAGRTIQSYVYFEGSGEWNMQDSLVLVWSRDIYLNKGTLRTNNHDVFARSFNSTSGNTRALYMGTSVFRLNNSTTFWNVSAAGLTLDATNSIIIANNNSGNIPTFSGGGLTYNNLYFTGPATAAGTVNGGNTFNLVSFIADYPGFFNTINGNNNITTLTFLNGCGIINGTNTIGTLNLVAGKIYKFQNTKTQTITTINAPSTCGKYITLQSTSAGSQATISSPVNHIFSYLTLQDMNVTGAGAPFTASTSIDLGNNTGWNLTGGTPKDLYWIGGTGNWSDGNHWSLTSGGAPLGCSPTYVDNVFFDANSFSGAGQTVTIDINPASCNNMDWTGALYNPTFTGVLNDLKIYGSLTFIYAMNYTSDGPVYFLATTPGQTINTAGRSIASYIYFNGVGGEWTLQDSLVSVWYRDIYLNNGTLITNNHDVFGRSFNSTSGNTRALYAGTSVFRLTDGGNFWNVSATNFTLDADSTTIISTQNGGNISTFNGGTGFTYNNVYFTGVAAASGVISGSNTFNNVSFAASTYPTFYNTINGTNTFNKVSFLGNGAINGTNTFDTLYFTPGKSFKFASGSTQTITPSGLFDAIGNGGFPIEILASNPGSQATISKSSGIVCLDYILMTDLNATGGATFFTGANSTDLGNNTGWTWAVCGPPSMSLSFSKTDVVCQNDSTGKAKVTVTGGTAPFTYLWSTGATIDSIINIPAGKYYVTVTDATPQQLIDSVTINYTYSLPSAYNVTGGGAYCAGDNGVTVGLDNSAASVKYQLYCNGTALWAPLTGTGSSISFGNQIAAGTYTVIATDTTTTCSISMSGNAIVTINSCYSHQGISINSTGAYADPSAILDAYDTISGALIPHLTDAERNAIPSPANGLIIYNSTTNKINFYYSEGWHETGTAFVSAVTGSISSTGGVAINLTGDSAVNSAILDINNNNSGVLIPRTLPGAILSPAEGLIIYNISSNRLNYYNGTTWTEISASFITTTTGGASSTIYGCAINYSGAAPDPSSIIDMDVNDKGFLIPRITSSQRDNILPATGLIIYNLTDKQIEYFDGTNWLKLL